MAKAPDEIKLKETTLPHVFLCDIDDSGLLKEILVIKKFNDGSIAYVDIEPLHGIDKSRIKKIITSQHADKYECWELLSQNRLSNGINALDFIHSNFMKLKRPKGARSSHASLASFQDYGNDSMIGSNHVNPAEVNLDTSTGVFSSKSRG